MSIVGNFLWAEWVVSGLEMRYSCAVLLVPVFASVNLTLLLPQEFRHECVESH